MRISKFKIFISVFSIFLLSTFYFRFSTFSASAQTAPQTSSKPEFLISWKTNSYAPSWYQGKIFPTRGSRVEAAFELIDNGKIVDISKNKARWYINDKLVLNEKNGLGIKNYSFRAFDYPGQDIELRIVIVDYKEEQIGGMIIIPIVHSEAVIDAPYAAAKIFGGAVSSFSAYPFFFNISDFSGLSFQWFVDGRLADSAGQPQKLDLNIDSKAPVGFGTNVRLRIANLADEINFANSEIKFNVK
ncbi:hypothetical protein HZB04_01840 [Candidatus Wolfebacteria bacterium]|nr:hypothetical protein [Candidatus Wolfebacteria bacterium]